MILIITGGDVPASNDSYFGIRFLLRNKKFTTPSTSKSENKCNAKLCRCEGGPGEKARYLKTSKKKNCLPACLSIYPFVFGEQVLLACLCRWRIEGKSSLAAIKYSCKIFKSRHVASARLVVCKNTWMDCKAAAALAAECHRCGTSWYA